jgi:hypothetical protein
MKKTLSEIIEDVKDGRKPDYDDLRYALLALAFLQTFDAQDILKVYDEADKADKFILKFLANENFNRRKRAMSVPPKDYIGNSFNPDNPDYQEERQMMNKLADKIFAKQGESDTQADCNHEWTFTIKNLEGYIRGNQNPVTRHYCKKCGKNKYDG